MNTLTKGISMFLLSILIMALLITTALGFMLGLSHPLPWVLIAILIIIPFIHEKILARQLVKWEENMAVGIELIDNDHKTLLKLINELQTATQYKVDKTKIDEIMDQLINYTKYHFDREEFLMRNNNYPDYENHKKLHEDMINKMAECMEKYKSDPDHTIDDALAFLTDWLIKHIKGNDREYIPYIKNTGLKGHEHKI
ncbi:MAG: hemerythrin family protein [Gammaproteobacteria bacterium]|nr:hemerythrin family protein [Gammaproteobacteria bacterium]